jgi:hypothetical protein
VPALNSGELFEQASHNATAIVEMLTSPSPGPEALARFNVAHR